MSAAVPEVENQRRRLKLALSRSQSVAMATLVVFVIAGLAAPVVVSLLGLKGPEMHDAGALNLFGNPTGPSGAHPLGVDTEGRDVLSRILYGLRSLVLVSLAGGALALAASWGFGLLAGLHVWVRVGLDLVFGALSAFPTLLFGLALGLAIGPGVWRLILVVALAQLVPVNSWRDVPRLAIGVFGTGAAIDFGLTFLGDSTVGNAPQLGVMVARSGESVLAGVPVWWGLLFPGLAVILLLTAARVLAPPTRFVVWQPRGRGRAGLSFVADQIAFAAVRLLCVFGLATLMFKSLGGSDPGSLGASTLIGRDLGASLSVLAGGVVVWLSVTLGQVWWSTRVRRLRRGLRGRWARAAGLPAVALSGAPAGWLAFLALYVFSESVGKLPILPGAGAYVGLTRDPGHWAESLLIPWLLVGLLPAALMAPSISARVAVGVVSGQQRVARAAGVPERILARQLRCTLAAPLLELAQGLVGFLLGTVAVVEASFRIPGVGLLAVSDFGHDRAATIADVTTLAAVVVVIAGLILTVARAQLDPRLAERA